LLKAYRVDDVKKLPFNYGGFIMAEGERITAGIYSAHQKKLNETFQRQNSITAFVALLNPYLALKQVSMALTASDFETFVDFQNQAETYRYGLAQKMNKLQIDKISNEKPGEHDKPLSISHSNWAEQPDFNYKFKFCVKVLQQEGVALAALALWLAMVILLLQYSPRWIKTV